MSAHNFITLSYKQRNLADWATCVHHQCHTHEPVSQQPKSTIMACREAIDSVALENPCGAILKEAKSQWRQHWKALLRNRHQFMNSFQALVESSTIPELEAHWIEARMHLNMGEICFSDALKYLDALNIDTVSIILRVSETFRGVDDNQLRANVERQISRAANEMNKIERYYNIDRYRGLVDGVANRMYHIMHRMASQKSRNHTTLQARPSLEHEDPHPSLPAKNPARRVISQTDAFRQAH